MISTEVQRTLVKSPPELWSELSDETSLARHLSRFGAVRIVGRTAEERVDWEAERARGSIRIRPSGWGTRVTLTLERDGDAPGDRPAADARRRSEGAPNTLAHAGAETETGSETAGAGAPRPRTRSESAATASPVDATAPAGEVRPAPDVTPPPEAAAEPDPDASTDPDAEPSAGASEQPAAVPSAKTPASATPERLPRRSFLERVVTRWRRLIAPPASEPEAPDTPPRTTDDHAADVHAPSAPATGASPTPSAHAAVTKEPLAHANLAPQRSAPANIAPAPPSSSAAPSAPARDAASAPSALKAPAQPPSPPATTGGEQPSAAAAVPTETAQTTDRRGDEQRVSPAHEIAAELRAAEEAPADGDTAVLAAVLDSLGAAHHRPFSRS